MSSGGQNGQWVRTRTEADAKAFIQEKQAEQERSLTAGPGALVLGAVAVLFLAGLALYAWLN
ncbi:hypothetical protein GUY60_03195 [Streptomyces sp. YC537]|uniref:Uncharacterized protein n=1 Tax=Streptomyces boluensis TaxID=1775135 RepID=A0A964UJW9_9ACTN|nr:hypothetical protein [Streptomyces boluensis]